MASITITSPNAAYAGKIGGVQFAGGTATVDNATDQGKAVILFAGRQGWAYTGQAAVTETVAEGKPVSKWTSAECKAYLDSWHVSYPSAAVVGDLRAAVLDAFETKAQGGSAANSSAGHLSQTIPPEGAGPVTNPDKPDDAAKAALWVTPLVGNVSTDVAPTISVQPVNVTVADPATATFTVTAAGTPSPTFQWEKALAATPTVFAAVAGATAASYTTPATVPGDTGNKYRAIVSNSDGSVTSAVATLTVT